MQMFSEAQKRRALYFMRNLINILNLCINSSFNASFLLMQHIISNIRTPASSLYKVEVGRPRVLAAILGVYWVLLPSLIWGSQNQDK